MSRPQARVATVVLDVIAIGFWFAMGQPIGRDRREPSPFQVLWFRLCPARSGSMVCPRQCHSGMLPERLPISYGVETPA